MKTSRAVAGVVAVAAVVGGTIYWTGRDNGETNEADDGPTFVISPVERRTLVDEVTVRGQIRRDELQRITSGIEGQVSSVLVEAGDTINAGDTIIALSGRAAVAVPGEFSFFRPLDVGSEGPDVRQLETILALDGYDVGDVDDLFTEATRSGLGAWQADRGYGGANPENTESITVGLQGNGAGYSVGAKNTLGIQVVPRAAADVAAAEAEAAANPELSPTGFRGNSSSSFVFAPPTTTTTTLAPATTTTTPPSTTQAPPTTAPPATSTTSTTLAPTTTVASRAVTTTTAPIPNVEVRVSPGIVVEGGTAVFTFTSDIAMPVNTTIDYVIGGDADGADDYDADLTGSFVFPAGQTSFDLIVPTLVDDIIESDEELVISVGNGFNVNNNARYRPGAVNEARLTIQNPAGEQPRISVRNEQTRINEGANAAFIFKTDRERNEPLTIRYAVSGSASEFHDYGQLEREIELPAGATEVTLNIGTISDGQVENDEYLVITVKPGNEYGRFGDPADVIIESSDLPELTLSGGGEVGEGNSTTFRIEADQAPITDTSVNYSIGGSAVAGVDYEAMTGTVILPAGQTAVELELKTIDDDVVFRPGDMIVAEWPAQVGVVNVDEGEFILLGTEILTLTEPDFTITLQLSPTDRSNLAVGLETSVELQASSQAAVPGVIVELDDTATISADGSERYEGVIETSVPLDAVDGASVNVDVVLERRENVITVPVASVLQDGQGNDVVRVVLEDGTTRQVAVDIGLSEGAFVEVREGLAGDELVLVET